MEPIKTLIPKLKLRRNTPPALNDGASFSAYPTWLRSAISTALPDDCRAQCMDCRGWGIWRSAEMAVPHCDTCCHSEIGAPCLAHVCKRCNGSGRVCPTCRGDRWTRLDVPVGHPEFGKPQRCTACWSSGSLDVRRERDAIHRYLMHYTPDQRPSAQRAAERDAAAKASYAEYVRMHGDPRQGYGQQHRPPTAPQERPAAARRTAATAPPAEMSMTELGSLLLQSGRETQRRLRGKSPR